ncbi:MAG: phosphoglucosamine mutase [Bryobacteraceae bacterium]|nr:phosphoglucosamine mutase [Bryobacterales bacterium]MEB2363103.1 phosphoglucosamine mutase [Bryobacterales bacterium]NUN00057.1 phosphoglucosamine mutase [Bryobacteraceae bacterium]
MPQREHLLKIGVSGIRGVVGEFLTPALACAFAQAFGTYVGSGRVVIGRDTRASGPMLQHAVTCGLLATGCDVLDVGVLPTPTIQIFTGATRARGGIAVTASHNPPEYNALKLFNAQGLFFNHYERNELVDLYHQSDFRQAVNQEIRCVFHDYDTPVTMHFQRVLQHVDTDRIRRKRFRVALDSVNGAGSLVSCRFLREALGCDLHAISVDPAKPFPREAEPRPDTLGELAELVRRERCEVGFGQDPDGDRLAVVDEHGVVLENDDVLALAVDAALRRVPGDVVVNLTTSMAVDDVASRHGRRIFRAPVGEANVVATMQSVQAAIGGEGSNGGIIFPAAHLCRDSYTGMAFMLDRMAETGLSVSQLAEHLPRYHRKFGKVGFEHGKLGPLMQALEESFPEAQADRSDGVKLMWPDAWIHVRASNTEPLLRLAAEAKSQDRMASLYAKVVELLEN